MMLPLMDYREISAVVKEYWCNIPMCFVSWFGMFTMLRLYTNAFDCSK